MYIYLCDYNSNIFTATNITVQLINTAGYLIARIMSNNYYLFKFYRSLDITFKIKLNKKLLMIQITIINIKYYKKLDKKRLIN